MNQGHDEITTASRSMVACATSDSDLTKLVVCMRVEHKPRDDPADFRRHLADDALVRRRHFLEIPNCRFLILAIIVAS